ncbi:hypothetical protein D3C71_1537320 [compost metagenome]
MALANTRTIFGFYTCVMPSALRTQPQCECGYLRRARIDIYAVDVVFNDQARRIAEVRILIGVSLAQRFEAKLRLSRYIQGAGTVLLLPCPCFAVNFQK